MHIYTVTEHTIENPANWNDTLGYIHSRYKENIFGPNKNVQKDPN